MSWRDELQAEYQAAQHIMRTRLSQQELGKIEEIGKQYPVLVTRHYLNLLELENQNDPLYKLCIPCCCELEQDGMDDVSGEQKNTKNRGMQHKYERTLLLLATSECASYCRHCFRKRMVGKSKVETGPCLEEVVRYVESHSKINNILISGGDSFMLSTGEIEAYLHHLCKLKQIRQIRFGTRILAVFPNRILHDQDLMTLLGKYSCVKNIFVMTQFNHAREITPQAKSAVKLLQQHGITLRNQTVLLKGVNDQADTMSTLIRELDDIGIAQYYIFQCRPVKGVKNQFQVSLQAGVALLDDVRSGLNGLEKCYRYILSHETGKIELLGLLKNNKYAFKYHQAKNTDMQNKLFTLNLQIEQAWIG